MCLRYELTHSTHASTVAQNKQECIPVGCVPPAAVAICGEGSASVHAGMHPTGCGPGDPPRCGPGEPPGVGLETPPGQTPQTPPWVWAWKPARHAGMPPLSPVNRITDTCKNITLPQLRCGW